MCGMFTGRGDTVVAGGTGAGHVAMDETDIQPVGCGEMAIITLCSRRHMSGILTGGGDAVMAIRTVACCIGVIELYRQPVGL